MRKVRLRTRFCGVKMPRDGSIAAVAMAVLLLSVSPPAVVRAVGKIALVNPDYYRAIQYGVANGGCSPVASYNTIACGDVPDGCSFTSFACWSGIGTQPDFLGGILSAAVRSISMDDDGSNQLRLTT